MHILSILFGILLITTFQVDYSTSEEILDGVEKFRQNAETVVDILKESDVTKRAAKLLKSVGIVTDILSIFITEDSVSTKLDAMMENINIAFRDLNNKIDGAVARIEGFSEENQFESEVSVPANKIFLHIRQFFMSPDKRSREVLLDKCKIPPIEYLNAMNTLLDGNSIMKENKADDFSDSSFNKISNRYRVMTKAILVSSAVCDNLAYPNAAVDKYDEARYKITIEEVEKIESRITSSDKDRTESYWPDSVRTTAERLMGDMKDEPAVGGDRRIAETIQEKLTKDYSDSEFFVGIYKIDGGNINHGFTGLSDRYMLLKGADNRKGFIYRQPKGSSVQKCDISKLMKEGFCLAVMTRGNKKTLVDLAVTIGNNCKEAKFIGVIQEKSNLGVAGNSNSDVGFFENYHRTRCQDRIDISVVVGW